MFNRIVTFTETILFLVAIKWSLMQNSHEKLGNANEIKKLDHKPQRNPLSLQRLSLLFSKSDRQKPSKKNSASTPEIEVNNSCADSQMSTWQKNDDDKRESLLNHLSLDTTDQHVILIETKDDNVSLASSDGESSFRPVGVGFYVVFATFLCVCIVLLIAGVRALAAKDCLTESVVPYLALAGGVCGLIAAVLLFLMLCRPRIGGQKCNKRLKLLTYLCILLMFVCVVVILGLLSNRDRRKKIARIEKMETKENSPDYNFHQFVRNDKPLDDFNDNDVIEIVCSDSIHKLTGGASVAALIGSILVIICGLCCRLLIC